MTNTNVSGILLTMLQATRRTRQRKGSSAAQGLAYCRKLLDLEEPFSGLRQPEKNGYC